MQRNADYGSEGECLVTHENKAHPDASCPLRVEYERRGGDPFRTQTWHSHVALILQTFVLLGSLLGFVRYIEKRIDAVDAHLTSAAQTFTGHVRTHAERDRARLLLHNSCTDAMKSGCHPAARFEGEAQ